MVVGVNAQVLVSFHFEAVLKVLYLRFKVFLGLIKTFHLRHKEITLLCELLFRRNLLGTKGHHRIRNDLPQFFQIVKEHLVRQ